MKSRCLHHRQEFLMYNCYPAERFTETITILPIRRNHVSSLRPRPAFWLDIQSKQSSWSGFQAVSVKKEITESMLLNECQWIYILSSCEYVPVFERQIKYSSQTDCRSMIPTPSRSNPSIFRSASAQYFQRNTEQQLEIQKLQTSVNEY